MTVRDATPEDWPKIWPFFREIVAAGETFAYDTHMDESTAKEMWLVDSPGRTAVAVDGETILGSAYGLQKLDEMRRHEYPAGFPVRLALKDLELVREVEQSSQAAMPVLNVVLERFSSASEDHADEDLASVYELGRSG
jgi:hypothetical protein